MSWRRAIQGWGATLFVLLLGAAAAWAQSSSDSVEATITGVDPERVTTGDTLTIRGARFAVEPWRTQVTVDGLGISGQYVQIISSSEIRLRVTDYETRGTRKAPGEHERAVVVWVDGKPSNPATFIEIDWGVIAEPRVFVPTIVYLVFILGMFLFLGGGLFQSATGNLSLSKIQMGVWVLVFSFSYVLLAAIWRDFIPITPGMLWLLGISSATAVAAKAIAVKNDPLPKPRNRASRLCSEIHPTLGTYRCEIPRCQVLLWTLIVLVIYVVKVISTMRLPDIPDFLLVLMGVGSGTYLGFKYPKTLTVTPPQPREAARPDFQQKSSFRRRRRPRRSGGGGGGEGSKPTS